MGKENSYQNLDVITTAYSPTATMPHLNKPSHPYTQAHTKLGVTRGFR